MNIAVLTMFNGLAKTYSLVHVVEEQLAMMLDEDDLHIRMLVSEDCPDHERNGIFADPRIEWVKVTNRYQGKLIHWKDYAGFCGEVHDTFFGEARAIADDLVRKLRGMDVCIMHDILYQGWHLVHNIAVRRAQLELPGLRFIAVTHSLPEARPFRTEWPFSARYSPMPNTTWVYPTESGLRALAQQYNISEANCRAVHNSFNPLAEGSADLLALSRRVDLFTSDVLIVYPGRLTPGKQFEKAAALAGTIRSMSGLSVQLLFCDFPSLDIPPATYKAIIREQGKSRGLLDGEIVFTSDEGWPGGYPHHAVMELFGLSNLFICSSYSESFGLIVLEAASRGNLIVLNEAVPALKELGASLGAYFMRWNARNFGYDTRESYEPSEEAYLKDHASVIVEKLKSNPVLAAKTAVRQRYHPKWVWKQQLEPLLREGRAPRDETL